MSSQRLYEIFCNKNGTIIQTKQDVVPSRLWIICKNYRGGEIPQDFRLRIQSFLAMLKELPEDTTNFTGGPALYKEWEKFLLSGGTCSYDFSQEIETIISNMREKYKEHTSIIRKNKMRDFEEIISSAFVHFTIEEIETIFRETIINSVLKQ